MNTHAIVTVESGVFYMWSAQWPFLGNSMVNTFPRQWTRTQQKIYCSKWGVLYVVRTAAVSGQQLGKHIPAAMDTNTTIEERWFLRGLCRELITRTAGAMRGVECCMGGCADRTWSREAEEYQLLEAVARERLVKTQQAGKGLAGAVVICELWR
jgi:hypothetical protein